MDRQPHPMDEGMPSVPDEYLAPCENCESLCSTNEHHLYYPRRAVAQRGILHSVMRTMIKVDLCPKQHERFHHDFEPPEPFTDDFVAGYIIGSDVNLSLKAKEALNNFKRGKHE